MFSARFGIIRSAALAAVATLVAPAVADAAIVVGSSGPSAATYPVGRKLDDSGVVTLRAGDTLTILDGRGTRVLKGGGTFAVTVSSTVPAKNSTFAVLTMQRAAKRVRTGAVRAGKDAAPPASPNLWFIDVAKSGKRCLVEGEPVRFWRLDTDQPATYAVAPVAGGTSASLAFTKGAMVAPWDTESYPVADGANYAVTLDGKPVGTIEIALLPSQPEDAEAMAATLIERGCTAQLDLLTSTLAQP